MKMEMDEMKLSMVEREEKVLEESLEGRLEKERNLAVIESARSEQSMLREAIRNLKIEKIRLLKRMDVYSGTKKVPEVAKQEVVGLEDFTNRFILGQQVDNKLRHELDQLISVAMEHQDKLNRTVEQIEKDVEKKCELEMIVGTDVKIDSVEEEVIETKFKEENTAEHIHSKKYEKLNALKEKIKSVEKEIEEKSSALEEILATVGSLVLADREKMKMQEEKRKMVEQRKEEIVLEKRNIEIERVEKIAQFKEEKNNLERKELALNISLASLNMDIERERSKMMRFGGKGMFLSGDGLEVEDLVLPGHGDKDEQAGVIRESE